MRQVDNFKTSPVAVTCMKRQKIGQESATRSTCSKNQWNDKTDETHKSTKTATEAIKSPTFILQDEALPDSIFHFYERQ
jgi:hypothetical protein